MMWKTGAVFAVWITACVTAAYAMMSYDFRPGLIGEARASWPADSSLPRSAARMTAVAFLHPRCVCSSATVTQLIRTLKTRAGVDVVVPVFVPADSAADAAWDQSPYVQRLRAELPRAAVVFDRGGAEAQRFGAWTSGTVLGYDPAGREVFRGGITSRRGGEDENPGRQRLARTLAAPDAANTTQPSPVFGCPILTGSSQGAGS